MGVYISGISKEAFKTLIGRALFEGLEPNLIEIKTPHGRLIDEEKIVGFSYSMNCEGRVLELNDVEAPTVIEAEVE